MNIGALSLLVSIFFLTSVTLTSFGHGEDRAGPNGGFIRMPGTFHTELVITGKNKLKLFLLDIEWKNPSVKGSSVRISFGNKNPVQAKCAVMADHYLCEFPEKIDLTKKGRLTVLSQRENQKGVPVDYALPLKLGVSN